MAVLSIIVAIWNAARPDRSSGTARNTYGTRVQGHRGLYELLGELAVPVDRAFLPPHRNMQGGQVFALVDSDPVHINFEPEYIHAVSDWVQEGGHAVVALKPYSFGDRPDTEVFDKETSVLEALDLADQVLREVTPKAEPLADDKARKPLFGDKDDAKEWDLYRRKLGVTTLTLHGEAVPNSLTSAPLVVVPTEGLQVLDTHGTSTQPAVALRLQNEDGVHYTLAAVFRRGKGKVTVLSDSELLHNRVLAREQNSVLAWQLFGHGSMPVVFDEFYHGLTVQGNPFYLFTKPAYAWTAAMLLLATLLYLWRQSVALGPPQPEATAAPRTIRDYLNAMSRMFIRAHARRFLLDEMWKGALWVLGKQLHHGTMKHAPHDLLPLLERRDPRRATQFKEVVEQVGKLQQQGSISSEELRHVSQRIKECL